MRGNLRTVALLQVLGASFLSWLIAAPAAADVVVPGPDVTTRVVVRASASGQSAQVDSLSPGQQAALVGSVPNWYGVRLANGTPGFVSKRWTKIFSAAGP